MTLLRIIPIIAALCLIGCDDFIISPFTPNCVGGTTDCPCAWSDKAMRQVPTCASGGPVPGSSAQALGAGEGVASR